MKPSNSFYLIRSGLIAGLIMSLIAVFFMLFMNILFMGADPTSAGMGIGILTLCLFPFWLAGHGVLGVSLYKRSSIIVSPKDGAQIGAISSIFIVIISLGFGILSDTILYDPNNLIRGAAFGMGLTGAGTATILSTLGGLIWASNLKNNSVQSNDVVNPITTNQIITIAPSNKSPIVASLLSLFLFGGVGQIYLGQWKKGLALILVSFFFGPLYFLTIPLGASDAYGTAQKLKNGNPVGEWEFTVTWKTFGLAFVATILVIIIFLLLYLLGYLLIAYTQGTLRIPI